MLRYLSHAFRAPLNTIAVAAALIAGWFAPEYWVAGGIAELVYLITLAWNPGFRHWVDTRSLAALDTDTNEARRKLLANIGGAARQRYIRIEEKRARIEKLSQDAASENLLFDSNRDALRKLTWLFLQLLVAQRNLVVMGPRTDPSELAAQIAAIEAEIASLGTGSLRESKEATLRLLRERHDNLSQRENSLAQIESDLSRIEAQIDLALEEAALQGRPASLSASVEVTSELLTNVTSNRETEP
jgi:hypothetical protein